MTDEDIKGSSEARPDPDHIYTDEQIKAAHEVYNDVQEQFKSSEARWQKLKRWDDGWDIYEKDTALKIALCVSEDIADRIIASQSRPTTEQLSQAQARVDEVEIHNLAYKQWLAQENANWWRELTRANAAEAALQQVREERDGLFAELEVWRTSKVPTQLAYLLKREKDLEAALAAAWGELAEIDGHESLAKAISNAIGRRNEELLALDSLLMKAEAALAAANRERDALSESPKAAEEA